jgi:hypothetical protein
MERLSIRRPCLSLGIRSLCTPQLPGADGNLFLSAPVGQLMAENREAQDLVFCVHGGPGTPSSLDAPVALATVEVAHQGSEGYGG